MRRAPRPNLHACRAGRHLRAQQIDHSPPPRFRREYMRDKTAMTEAEVAREIERYVVMPNGAMPLGVLEENVSDWIAAEKAKG